MMYNKLKRVWSHNDMNYIPKFKETFPELRNVSSEELCDRFAEMGVDWYAVHEKPVPFLIRLTLPFALILLLLMFIALPIVFMVRGSWSYGNPGESFVFNWFKMLRLV